MRVALLTEFTASRKEPLATLVERIHEAFVMAGLGAPKIEFCFSDPPLPGYASGVDRVLKRHAALERFVASGSVLPGAPTIRQIANTSGSPAAGEQLDFATLMEIAAGVPRSFPFHNVAIRFHAPVFGEAPPAAPPFRRLSPGVHVGDAWWVNGRMRSLMSLTDVDADPAGKRLPALPERVTAVLAACGKVKKTVQVPLEPGSAVSGDGSPPARPAIVSPEIGAAVGAIVADYRTRLAEVVERAQLPHELPSAAEALRTISPSATTGPKKPVLVRAFKPLGYDCRAESGTFTLRRRTAGNLTAEIHIDVGTWSRSLTGSFSVVGLGFRARLPLPVSRHALDRLQYQIGDAHRWQQIVENLAALVAEYDRSFVCEVEAAAGPSPDWFTPEN